MNINEILTDIKSKRTKKVIIDTDAFNEIDDQYAITYCYLSDAFDILSINAAPYYNDRSTSFEDGMLKSYDEIHHVLKLIDPDCNIPVYYGSRTTIEESGNFVDSPAARNIINTVKASDELIYVLAIGAITNVASALAIDPSIKDNMCVIWVGSNWIEGDNLEEFNLLQDYKAGQSFINSAVPTVLCPAWCVSSVLTTNINLTQELKGKSRICDYLAEITEREYAKCGSNPDWTRTIWDIAAPAIIENPDCAALEIVTAPAITDQKVYAFDSTRHKMIYVRRLNRDAVFNATWRILTSHSDK